MYANGDGMSYFDNSCRTSNDTLKFIRNPRLKLQISSRIKLINKMKKRSNSAKLDETICLEYLHFPFDSFYYKQKNTFEENKSSQNAKYKLKMLAYPFKIACVNT